MWPKESFYCKRQSDTSLDHKQLQGCTGVQSWTKPSKKSQSLHMGGVPAWQNQRRKLLLVKKSLSWCLLAGSESSAWLQPSEGQAGLWLPTSHLLLSSQPMMGPSLSSGVRTQRLGDINHSKSTALAGGKMQCLPGFLPTDIFCTFHCDGVWCRLPSWG